MKDKKIIPNIWSKSIWFEPWFSKWLESTFANIDNTSFDWTIFPSSSVKRKYIGWEIETKKDKVEIKVYIPGAKKESIDIEASEKEITVSAEIFGEKEEINITLYNPIDIKDIKTDYKDGVLYITAKPKKLVNSRKIKLQ